jgi:chromosome segregation ATPase
MPEGETGYIGAVAADLGQLRAQLDKVEKRSDDNRETLNRRIDQLQNDIHLMQLNKLSTLDVSMEGVKGRLAATEKAIDTLTSSQVWLFRTAIGSIVVAVVGLAFALIQHGIGPG